MMFTGVFRCAVAAISLFLVPAHATAADTSGKPALALELNNLGDTEKGCLATFLVTNGLQSALDKIAFEVVFFGEEGQVDRMLVLDFSPLTQNKTRVRQFDLTGAKCSDITRVLINDAAECEGSGIESGGCIGQLVTSSRVSVEFGS